MLQFFHGINRIVHFSYSVCIVFRDCLVLGKCNLLRFRANANRMCWRRAWHIPHPKCSLVLFCYRQTDVSLLESKASCCAADHTARQYVVHFGICKVWDLTLVSTEVWNVSMVVTPSALPKLLKIFLHASCFFSQSIPPLKQSIWC